MRAASCPGADFPLRPVRESPGAGVEAAAERLIRLPIWSGMTEGQALWVVETVAVALHARQAAATI